MSRTWTALGVVAAVAALGLPTDAWAQRGQPLVVDFESGDRAALCTAGLTGGGGPVDWTISTDEAAPAGARVLTEQSRDRTGYRFPLCIFDTPDIRDVAVTVAFKPVSGEVDQAAGLMVRVRDPNNYYIARANALEGNVRFYKVVDGERSQIEGVSADIAPGQWHELGVSIRGDTVEVSMDGTRLFAAQDDTFPDPGRVGVWTKADSVTLFDNVRITPLS